ncbi:hypothetical protein [uncultured Microbacterium sp.]|uniref:DUF3846 domain-containing protein n=1 Tax=uncultured Microbacterium sp. TaxID=191216 RepID=UPI00262DBB30|nr:hypothetical protein [uncultured Microbacterium sp.]
MVHAIVIPRDGGGDLWIAELAGLKDFQTVIGGWIEPIELDGSDTTLYANGGIQCSRGPFNSRATALYWYHGQHRNRPLILGDVVLVGTDPGVTEAAEPRLIHGLLAHHEFVVQLCPDGLTWCDTSLRFPSWFSAALWAMVIDSTLPDSVGLRIEALDDCAESPSEEMRSW